MAFISIFSVNADHWKNRSFFGSVFGKSAPTTQCIARYFVKRKISQSERFKSYDDATIVATKSYWTDPIWNFANTVIWYTNCQIVPPFFSLQIVDTFFAKKNERLIFPKTNPYKAVNLFAFKHWAIIWKWKNQQQCIRATWLILISNNNNLTITG